ncbi:MAG: hypothetical protein R3C99_06425 [Pirellulaceae bacterium]
MQADTSDCHKIAGARKWQVLGEVEPVFGFSRQLPVDVLMMAMNAWAMCALHFRGRNALMLRSIF